MESLVTTLITQYGIPGLILGLLIWQQVQNNKSVKQNVSKEDLRDVQFNIKQNVEGHIDNIKSYIVNEREVLKEMIDLTGERLDDLKERVDDKISAMSDKIDIMGIQIDNQPMNIIESMQIRENAIKEVHDSMFDKQLLIGSDIQDILNTYRNSCNFDHIFLGSFHNGTSNLSGIPYYKFDLIAERFRPDKIHRDVEFSHMYYNADLMKHGKLPITIIQNNKVHYIIDENGDSELSNIDDIIYRRMRGRDIKQLAIQLIKDSKGKPTGFVGGVKYDYQDINMEELDKCSKALEKIYK